MWNYKMNRGNTFPSVATTDNTEMFSVSQRLIQQGGSQIIVQCIKAELGQVADLNHEFADTVGCIEMTSEVSPGMVVVKEEATCWDDNYLLVRNNTEHKCDDAGTNNTPLMDWKEGGLRNALVIKEEPIFYDFEQRCDDSIAEGLTCVDDSKLNPVDPEFVSVGIDSPQDYEAAIVMSMDPLAGGVCASQNALNISPRAKKGHSECSLCPTCNKTYPPRDSFIGQVVAGCACKKPTKEPFTASHSLGIHVKKVSGYQKPYKCEICEKTFTSFPNLRRHLLRDNCSDMRYTQCHGLLAPTKHNCAHNKPQKCDACGKGFSDSNCLRKHIKYYCRHLQPCTCLTCNKTYSSKDQLDAHMKHDCGRQEPHKCETCGKTFTRWKSLREHVRHECGRSEPHKCITCNKTYTSRVLLKVHLRYDCGRKAPHQCDMCGKTYTYWRNLHQHVRHDCGRSEPHRCSTCNKICTSIYALKQHMKYDCGRQEPHKCETCGKTFTLWGSLRKHATSYCRVAVGTHTCTMCSKVFTSKSNLRCHMKHDCNRQQPHKCLKCSKTFTTIHCLRHHVKHDCSLKEPHKCERCNKIFLRFKSLRRHMNHYCRHS